MMGFWKFALVPVLALLAGCAGFHVKYDSDPHAPFATYKTFAWNPSAPKASGGAGGLDNPIMERRVRRIVEAELAARGYQRSEGKPDFLLSCYPAYRDRVVETYTAVAPAWGWGRPWGYGAGPGLVQAEAYREASIVLEVADARSGQMVWQAVAEGALDGIRDPQDAEEQVGLAVKKMVARFPPPKPR
jgi:hypothetical protein